MAIERPKGFNVFTISDEVSFSRVGKKVQVRGRDGTFQESDTVEANLLMEILKELRRKK